MFFNNRSLRTFVLYGTLEINKLIWKIQETIRERIKKAIFCMLPILLRLPPLILPNQSIYTIEGKFELNQKILWVWKLLKPRISRTDLGIKLKLQRMLKGEDHLTKRQYVHFWWDETKVPHTLWQSLRNYCFSAFGQRYSVVFVLISLIFNTVYT